jgi:hypothetical protein
VTPKADLPDGESEIVPAVLFCRSHGRQGVSPWIDRRTSALPRIPDTRRPLRDVRKVPAADVQARPAFDLSRTSRHHPNGPLLGETRNAMLGVSLSAKPSHWHGAEGKVDFRTSHILTAFAKSVSPHSYKGRMKSDWV